MEVAIVLAGAAALFAAPVLLTRYWQLLPEAPSCPLCRTVTHRLQDEAVSFSLLGHLPLPVTAVRSCSRCGWQGRMRWRWAPNWVRRD